MNGLNVAIIIQAIDDYKRIVSGLEEATSECNLYEIESFLKSQWCDFLLLDSCYSPDDLLRYVHKFKENWEREHPDNKDKLDKIKELAIMHRCMAIMCVETGKVFYGLRSAALSMHTKAYQIARSIKNENITAGGYHFKVVYDPYADNGWHKRETNKKPNKNVGTRGSFKTVRCIDTGEVYVSTKEASAKNNVSARQISRCARGEIKRAGGLKWEYTSERIRQKVHV